MIKIIKHGHAPYRMACRNCECIFTFEDRDIENNGYYEYILCPECNVKNVIELRSKYRNSAFVNNEDIPDNSWAWNV